MFRQVPSIRGKEHGHIKYNKAEGYCWHPEIYRKMLQNAFVINLQ